MIKELFTPAVGFIIATLFLLMSMMVLASQPVSAKVECDPGDPPSCSVCVGAGGNWSTAGCVSQNGNDPNLIEGEGSIFESIVNILSFIVGAIAVIMLIIGGLRYVLSNGDANAVGSAKNTILYAVIGIIVVFAARSIILFVVGEIG